MTLTTRSFCLTSWLPKLYYSQIRLCLIFGGGSGEDSSWVGFFVFFFCSCFMCVVCVQVYIHVHCAGAEINIECLPWSYSILYVESGSCIWMQNSPILANGDSRQCYLGSECIERLRAEPWNPQSLDDGEAGDLRSWPCLLVAWLFRRARKAFCVCVLSIMNVGICFWIFKIFMEW